MRIASAVVAAVHITVVMLVRLSLYLAFWLWLDLLALLLSLLQAQAQAQAQAQGQGKIEIEKGKEGDGDAQHHLFPPFLREMREVARATFPSNGVHGWIDLDARGQVLDADVMGADRELERRSCPSPSPYASTTTTTTTPGGAGPPRAQLLVCDGGCAAHYIPEMILPRFPAYQHQHYSTSHHTTPHATTPHHTTPHHTKSHHTTPHNRYDRCALRHSR